MEASKLLVANRGEIAVRIFRAAHELSLSTVAIYSNEDRLAGHRQKAQASFMIGEPGELSPVESYLQIQKIVEIAKREKVNFIHPGYGFLAENAQFATEVREAGIEFIGPSANVLQLMGDKVAARRVAKSCEIPTIPGTEGPVQDLKDAQNFVGTYGYPVVVKASFGGGGRGMRVVHEGHSLENAISSAKSEALSAFGNDAVFIERFLSHPKHIEVQVLSDKHGNHIHLFERDCSVQRRHQKVIEFAPSVQLHRTVREGLLKAAVKLATTLEYVSAGTVEFLVQDNEFYFIEMNPRIQVEHTVTEELTGVDIVKAQLQIALGFSLPELGFTQDKITQNGCAIQCRITTEIPSEDFRPDSGTINSCTLPSGNGIRLDYSDCFPGAQISPFYDSLLVKSTCWAKDLEAARQKSICTLKEFQLEGIRTNIGLLIRLLQNSVFVAGDCRTTFIDSTPEILGAEPRNDKGSGLLKFLGEAVVNGSKVQGQVKPPGLMLDPVPGPLFDQDSHILDTSQPCDKGRRYLLLERGPAEFAKAVRAHSRTLITDTTWRDGQQSLLATRVRTRDFARIAIHTSHAFNSAYSLECWGGATFDVSLRFLYECPWERLRKLRKLVPNIPFQMLLRSVNGVAYSALPDNALYHFVKHAKDTGVDIFRVFDSLNNTENLEIGINAVHAVGGLVEGAIMYTGDMLKPGTKYNLEYYLGVAEKLIEFGSHILAIKSMSGVMKPSAGRVLVRALRTKYPDIPIHMHTHDTNGTGVATMLACIDEGADIVDTAIDSLSGSTSQPAMSSLVAALQNTETSTSLELEQIQVIDAYWAQLRLIYAGFDADLHSPDPTVYKHEIPGGQYSNLMFQARQNGLGHQWTETQKAYEDANILLGDIIKATPTSKAVGDLAQFMVDRQLTPEEVLRRATTLDLPSSVLDYFEGLMGQPFDGFPEPFRTDALRNQRKMMSHRPGLTLDPVDFECVRQRILAKYPSGNLTDDDIASYIMYPEVYMDFRTAIAEFGDLTDLPTPIFMSQMKIGQEVVLPLESGKEMIVELIAIGNASKVTGKRQLFFRLNGGFVSVSILDLKEMPRKKTRKANIQIGEVAAPMTAKVVRILAQDGSMVKAGQVLLSVTAMKMEVNVTAEFAGRVENVSVASGDTVEKGDMLLQIVS
ncbi:hypothetical protein VTL71DRAFT_7755 [Oculimacula yallundae]|uniref:Pyruvate carboxylase n=1 Tax=Oculimacula yallundae TaxID=86028 RepID=A0ABR4CVW7_9HELO